MKCRNFEIPQGVLGFSSILSILMLLAGCKSRQRNDSQPAESSVPVIPYVTKAIYPHDTTLFTEGLVLHNGRYTKVAARLRSILSPVQ